MSSNMLEFFVVVYTSIAAAFYSVLAKSAPIIEKFETPANLARDPEIIELFPAQEDIRKVA